MQDTLKYHKSRPLQSNIDLSGASLQHVMNGYDEMKAGLTANEGRVLAYPETEALSFYVQQHAMSLVERNLTPEEPVGKFGSFIEQYHSEIHWKTLRMFYYLLLICTRESRHAGTGKTGVYKKYPGIEYFHKNHVSDSSAESAVQAIMTNAPDVCLGHYTNFLVDMFTECNYSPGYGGKAWAEVATPLHKFVQGEISAEIMMDTAFTLAHNNGPIFNKGMLYKNYNSTAIKKILDVQRSGQIPQLIAHHYSDLSKFVTMDLRNYVEEFGKLDSGFGGRVDWTAVKDIHGKAVWTAEVAAQKAADPKADWKTKLAAKIEEAKAKAAKIALLKGSYEIWPGVSVAKGKRSQK